MLSVLQGAGKSTFSHALISSAVSPWERVNQDSLKNRQRCERAAIAALQRGKNVIIDRCNFDQKQRATWVSISAAAGAACCALWIDIPKSESAERAVQRRSHEGGVTGAKAEQISLRISAHIKSVHSPLPECFLSCHLQVLVSHMSLYGAALCVSVSTFALADGLRACQLYTSEPCVRCLPELAKPTGSSSTACNP
jgi:predicted kinase